MCVYALMGSVLLLEPHTSVDKDPLNPDTEMSFSSTVFHNSNGKVQHFPGEFLLSSESLQTVCLANEQAFSQFPTISSAIMFLTI